MGLRILLIKDQTFALMLQPRGKLEALILRVAGPDIPEDAKTVNFTFIAKSHCFGIVLESPQWSDIVEAGATAETVNGIRQLPNAKRNFHLVSFAAPAVSFPPCGIEGYDRLPDAVLNTGAQA